MPQTSLEPLHRFHAYCARFPSEIVETVLEKYTEPGVSVLDLFCGSGTTLVASLAHKRKVVGTDICRTHLSRSRIFFRKGRIRSLVVV